MRKRVLDLLIERGAAGATDDELQVWLESDSQAVTPARLALERKGLLFYSGRMEATRDGYDAMVWVYKDHAHLPRRIELDVASGYCPACGRGRRTPR